ncbi:unnamed protein product [Chironomus riparius]|uniref:Uncharacterized protein n=1 Tax=Chironomus riparius TaxID=315576 RepID=A0A9N9S021_9DIPT|nr:unnamed protein product [Chironomus riparius]
MLDEEQEIENETARTSAISEESSQSVKDKLKYRENIDEKLKFYSMECKRYFMEKLKIVQQCIEENLQECCLKNSTIGSLQCQIMLDSFSKIPVTQLTAINLQNNILEHFCCHSMASFIDMNPVLRELNLAGCRIGDKGMEILAPAFATSSSLINLNLSNNQITDDGGEILVSFLMRNYVCRDLNLSSNKLGYKTAQIVGAVLMENDTLVKLDISHNRLYEQYAIVKIMKGLMSNESLEYLDISWNGLCGEPFGKILSKSIKGAALKVFKVEYNNLTSFEFRKLALGLKYSETIEELYVAGNFFTVDDDENLVKVFKTDSPLKLISFGDSFHLSHAAFEILQEVKDKKPSIHVIYQNIILPNPPRDVLMLDIYADRAKFLAMKPKSLRMKRDMSDFMTNLRNLENSYMNKADFLSLLKTFNAKLDDILIDQYIQECTVNIDGKPLMNVHLMANHYLNRHPKGGKQAVN